MPIPRPCPLKRQGRHHQADRGGQDCRYAPAAPALGLSNEALWTVLKKDKSALGKARLDYFWLNKGPWSILDDHQSFMLKPISRASRFRPRSRKRPISTQVRHQGSARGVDECAATKGQGRSPVVLHDRAHWRRRQVQDRQVFRGIQGRADQAGSAAARGGRLH
ncbi:hypothetical protein LP420_28200 [Massilia sp. B-10]|nr:hypothetical protein LP420_28200 [Massilia sp. B-10]